VTASYGQYSAHGVAAVSDHYAMHNMRVWVPGYLISMSRKETYDGGGDE